MLNNLLVLETVLAYAYAASLPLTLTGSWIILGIGLVVWLLKIALGLRDAKMAPFAVPLLIFLFAVAISGFVSDGVNEAFQSVWTFRALIVYLWGYQLFKTRRQLVFNSLALLLSISAVSGIWSAIQQLTGFHPFGYQWLQGTGFLSAPMAYAGQMQIFSLVALAFAIGKVSLDKKPGWLHPYLLAVFNCLGVLFAAERSAWLGFFAGVASLSCLKSIRFLMKSALVLTIVGALSFMFVPVVKQRLAPLANWQQDVSTRVRVQIWQESIDVWKTHSVFGVGISHFPRFDIPEAIVPGRSKDLNHAHSNYFQMLTCLGVVGLVAYLLLWIWILVSLARSYFLLHASGDTASSEQSAEKALLMGLFAATVALCVSGLFEYNFGTAQVRLAYWFLLSMYVKDARNQAV
ncbi:MAG: O-antigen ligase family protein [Candidatus Obscuribacterales bacterium]|nr:O-antigen ligase family protein [Candidatus Obscuribacterales bacterium]